MTDIDELVTEARSSSALLRARPWAVDSPDLIVRLADALEAVTQERDRAKSGAHTLGEIVVRHVEDTLRWAGMEDQIGTNDPDQQLAWELCAEMPGKIAALTSERDRYRATIDQEMTRHTEKHGETARYEAGDFYHELPPTHWEAYVICNACGTDYPCRTRQTLTRALKETT